MNNVYYLDEWHFAYDKRRLISRAKLYRKIKNAPNGSAWKDFYKAIFSGKPNNLVAALVDTNYIRIPYDISHRVTIEYKTNRRVAIVDPDKYPARRIVAMYESCQF